MRADADLTSASRSRGNTCPSAQIALAMAAATVIGLLDAALVVFGVAGAGGAFQFVPARIWVAAPLTWLAVAMLTAAVIVPITRRRSGVFVAATLAVTFLAIRLRAHPALLFVALAAFLVLLAVMRGWIRRWTARPRQSTAIGMFGTLGACAIVAAAQPLTSAPLPIPPAGTGPNVIVIFLDTVRYDALFDAEGHVHSDMKTIARLARESTAFTRAYAPSPWTLPSHLSAMTGLPVHELGVSFDSQVYDRAELTLAERFHQRGYRTAAVISNAFLNAGSGFARGFDAFQQAQTSLDVCRTAPGLMAETYWPWFAAAVCNWTASEVSRRARNLMDDEDRPFFLTLNYMDAHDPYYVERSCGGPPGYRAAIQCLDRHLAPIVDWRSPRRPTVLAIVGDHGEQFGEHGLQRHGNSLYVQLLHVPLIVRPASDPHSRQRAQPVSIAALPSLLLDDADGKPLRHGPVVGLLHPPADANLPSEWSALDTSWHLIVRERGPDALYHLPTDPSEEHNLISSNPADSAIAGLRASIAEMRRAPKPDLRRFRSLGYLH